MAPGRRVSIASVLSIHAIHPYCLSILYTAHPSTIAALPAAIDAPLLLCLSVPTRAAAIAPRPCPPIHAPTHPRIHAPT